MLEYANNLCGKCQVVEKILCEFELENCVLKDLKNNEIKLNLKIF